MSINIYEEVVMPDSDKEDEMNENGCRQENSDADANFYDNTGVGYEQIATMTTSNPNSPKKRGRRTKDEIERARLTALYHGTNSFNNSSNGGFGMPTNQKKRGRPPKSDSEKNNRPKSAIRIALGPKAAKIRRTEAVLPNDDASPFPLVQHTDAMKKSRGRPRIHPPKDTSVKRPRGRPRLVPLEGEAALRNAYLKLKRDCAKKDLIIKKLRERLEQFGHPVEDIMSEQSKLSEQNDDSEEQNRDGNDSFEDARTPPEPSSMEDTHQTYIGMFANTEDKNEDDSDSEEESE